MKEAIAHNLTRYRRGLQISEDSLAQRVGLSVETIVSYEQGLVLPHSKHLSLLAKHLGVTLDDLLDPVDETSSKLGNFCFRAHSSFTNNPAFATKIYNLLATYTALETEIALPPYAPETTPCDRVEDNENRIQQVAQSFRARLGIGDTPIANLFESVEELGLKILRLPIEEKGFFGLSAFSLTQGAFVLVNTHQITIERQLFTLAHELGHLIFHRDEYQDPSPIAENTEAQKARERVADYFASHLLISPVAFEQACRNMDYNLLKLKAYFRVSYATILKRFDELGIKDYGSMIKELNWRYKQEKGHTLTKDMELEPQLQDRDFPLNQRYQMLIGKALKQEKISELKAAELLGQTIESLRVDRRNLEVYSLV